MRQVASVAAIVDTAIRESGKPVRRIATEAGVSTATVHRVRTGTTDPTLGVLSRVLAACGSALAMGLAPMSDPMAVRAARRLLGWGDTTDADEPDLRWWMDKMVVATGGRTGVADIVLEAARGSVPQVREGAALLRSVRLPLTTGRLASAGDAAGGRWALSGDPSFAAGGRQAGVDGRLVLWVEDVERAVQLLSDTMRRVAAARIAQCVIAPGDADVFDRTRSISRLTWADPLQCAVDAVALAGIDGDAAAVGAAAAMGRSLEASGESKGDSDVAT